MAGCRIGTIGVACDAILVFVIDAAVAAVWCVTVAGIVAVFVPFFACTLTGGGSCEPCRSPLPSSSASTTSNAVTSGWVTSGMA